MKKVLLSLLCLLASLGVSAQFSGSGSGTSSDPYLIFNPIQLDQVRNFLGTSGVYFKLMANVDVSEFIADNNPSQGWQPIGTSSSPFKGVFDGNGKTISGLNISRSFDYVGFWGYLSEATIKNVTLNYSGDCKGSNYLGAFAGYASGVDITDCNVIAKTVSGTEYVGGFAGYASGQITNSTYDGKVISTGSACGCFVGYASSARFESCSTNADLSGVDKAAGFAGYAEATDIISCGYFGDVTASGDNVSGFVGYAVQCTMNNNYSVGSINANGDNVGGIVGCLNGDNPSVYYYYSNSRHKIGDALDGGIVAVVEYYYNTRGGQYYWTSGGGTTTSSSSGYKYRLTIVKDGYLFFKTSDNSYSIGQTTAFPGYTIIAKADYRNTEYYNSKSAYNANDRFVVTENSVSMISYEKGESYCYALVRTNNEIKNNYYNGFISGGNYVGGIVGKSLSADIFKNYSYGDVTGKQYVGGVIGSVEGGTLKSNVAINSSISAIAGDVGRVYGSDNGTTVGAGGTAERNIALVSASVSVNGLPLTVSDDLQNGDGRGANTLKYKATYQGIGWDFTNDWTMIETECYPYAPTQTAPPVINGELTAGMTTISGKSVDGGVVYVNIGDKQYKANVSQNAWTVTVPVLQSGAKVYVYAKATNFDYSYYTYTSVKFAGSGTAEDPYQVYTAENLANIYSTSHYKLMNDVDLTDYIATNSPTTGWTPIGKGGSVMAQFDGDGHTVSGLWINSTEDYVGLFSNASGAIIKNLKVKTASGKKVKGGNYTGGIIGRCYNGTIENCSFNGNVEGKNYTGGIVGSDDEGQNIKNKANGNVSGYNYVGGIAGYTGGGSISKAKFSGSVQSSSESANIGGIAGDSKSAMSQCYAAGTVSATGTGSIAGGVIGKNEAGSSVKDSYSTSAVTTTSYVGGVVGYNYGSIENCYSSGDLKSDADFGGGIVGYNDGTAATTKHSVAINTKITINDETGYAQRVVGGIKNNAPAPEMDNYANKGMAISINGIAQKVYDDNMNGTGKTLDVLKTQSAYEDLEWDFNLIWAMNESTNLPYLLAEISDPVSAKSVSLDKKSATIEIGKDLTLVATVLPDDATKKTVTWKSSNTSVATVVDGKVTGIAPGIAQITATTTDGSGLSAVCSVTVTTAIVPVSSITMSKSSGTVEIGNTLALKATISPDDATAKTVNWTTSNANVATVDNGLVTGVSEGTATITATTTDGTELSAKCVVSVKAKAMVYPTTDVSAYENVLYFNDVETSAGADLTLSLNMKNSKENITAFQCDVELPAGVNWASTVDKRGNVVLTQPVFNTATERTDASYHTISPVTQLSDGSYRVIVYSMAKETVLDLDGAVIDLPLTVSDDMEAGEYNIFIKNIVMTDVNTEQTLVEKVVSKLTIPSYTLGDVNDDKMINVTDVVAVVSYMLEDTPSTFVLKAADINADEKINVTDVVGIIDIINSESSAAKARKAIRRASKPKSTAPSGYSLEVVPFTVAAGTVSKTVSLDLINPEEDITAFQCDLYLPEGIDWASTTDRRGNVTYNQPTFNKAADRTDDTYHTISPVTKMSDGSFRIIVYSMKKEVFLDKAGAVIDLPLVFDEDLAAGVYDVKVGNMVLTKTDVTQELPADYTFSILVGSPEIGSAKLYGDYTAYAISELNTALASNTKVAALDFSEATDVDATTAIATGNANLLVYVAEGKSVKNESNAVIGDMCANLVLVDGYDFAAPKAFTAVTATYKANVSSSLGYKTLVLPYDCNIPTGFEAYEISGISGNTLMATQLTGIEANSPVILKNEGKATLSATNVEVAVTGGELEAGELVGTYEESDAPVGSYVLQNQGGEVAFYLVGNEVQPKVGAFRAYLAPQTSGAKAVKINFDGTSTGISNYESKQDAGTVYSVSGQRIEKVQRGVNIIRNGKGTKKAYVK